MEIELRPMIAFGYYKSKTIRKYNYLTLGTTLHHHIMFLCFFITINKDI